MDESLGMGCHHSPTHEAQGWRSRVRGCPPRHDYGDGSKDHGALGMAKMSMEIEGSIAEVVRVIRQLGTGDQRAT